MERYFCQPRRHFLSILRFFRTVRYLKPVQITNRFTRKFSRLKHWTGDIPSTNGFERQWETIAALPASIINDEQAYFLNEAGPLFQWRNPEKSELWLYNLHYFDDLHAQNASQRVTTHRKLIKHWLEANPPAVGVGWDPYPTSLRIVNWVKWLLAENEPTPGMLESIFQQAYVLSQQLEYHLQGNHLLANAKALVFAGSLFEDEEAQRWLQIGVELLDDQYREQILSDGAHFELSSMYHAIVLLDTLDLIQLAQCFPSGLLGHKLQELRATAAKMARWLEGMLHPDGQIPFFNDAAFSITPVPAEIFEYARKLGVSWCSDGGVSQYYDASGYIVVRQHNQIAILDTATIGPDYIPGHAHADTLSFEWSLFRQRVLVNSGISQYGVNAERIRQRGTSAHNTVVVGGENSSEVWSGFRVARRARPFGVDIREIGGRTVVKASHTGYQRLRPMVTHSREWRVEPGALVVKDSLIGGFKRAVAFFHLHPLVSVVNEGGALVLLLGHGQRCKVVVAGGSVGVEKCTWHPEFGISQPSKRISVIFSGTKIETKFLY